MTFISRTKLAESLNDRADARLRFTVQRWPGSKTREILPGLFLNLITFAIRHSAPASRVRAARRAGAAGIQRTMIGRPI